jgi:WD40 repeat protein/serine/threonine protein kinase
VVCEAAGRQAPGSADYRVIQMEIRCPGCQHPIELKGHDATDDPSETIASVECPNCGLVPLRMELGKTMTFEASLDELKDKKVAHFSLVRLLGRGSFGEVWLANDVILERQVALKLPVVRGGDTANLLHEAQTAAHLRHPNIVTIHEVGSESGQIFIASEYIEGLTLRDSLTSGTPTIARSVELAVAVARALDHAHEQGIVHRDVKPGNIILNAEGQPFITDFGLAKRISKDETISSEGKVLGTARYMSPEQASGKTRETDHRSDIYAIGVILFEMLTGHCPFLGNVRALIHQKIYEDAPSPRKLAPTLPRDLETVCLKCLEREPGKRYQSAAEVADELERFSAGEPIKARPVSTLERGWRWCRRRPAVAGLLAGLILSLSSGLIGVSFFYWQAAKSAELTRQSLYRSQMNLAAEYLNKGDFTGLRQTLDRVTSDDRLTGLRGFEWRYYDAVTAPFVQVVNHGDVVGDVAVSRDGELFASVGTDREIRVWDTKTGERICTMSLDAGRFRAIYFSPANNHLASGASDGWLRIWNPLKAERPIQKMKHGPPVAFVRFSPDGKLLLSSGISGAVRIWEEGKESPVAQIPAGQEGAQDARFSPDGKSVAVASRDDRVRLWDINSTTLVGDLQPNPLIESLAFSDDGQTIATGSYGGLVRVWSVSEETLHHTHNTVAGRIGDLEFVKGTPLLAILANDRRLHLYDTKEQRVIRKLKTHYLSDGVLARSDNGKLLVVGSGDGSVKVLTVSSVKRPNIFWHDQAVRGVAFLPGGTRLVAASVDGALRIWDTRSGESQPLADAHGQGITTMSIQPGGNLIATAGVDPRVALWDTESGKAIREVDVRQGEISVVAFSSSGQRLAVATRYGEAFLYDAADWTEPPLEIPQREAAVQALAFSPDDRDVVVGYEDGEVLVIDAENGTPRGRSIPVSAIPRALAFCKSGQLLAIGTDAGEIHLYNLASQQTRSVIKAHTSRINALAVLPDGTTVVSGGRDKELKLSDTRSGEVLTSLYGHLRQVFSLAVSADGETIASGGLEGDIRIWSARPAR